MSGSVTPARRRREDDDSDIEDFVPSIDGEDAPRSSGRKRARVDNGNDDDDERERDDEDEEEVRDTPLKRGNICTRS